MMVNKEPGRKAPRFSTLSSLHSRCFSLPNMVAEVLPPGFYCESRARMFARSAGHRRELDANREKLTFTSEGRKEAQSLHGTLFHLCIGLGEKPPPSQVSRGLGHSSWVLAALFRGLLLLQAVVVACKRGCALHRSITYGALYFQAVRGAPRLS